MRTMIALVCGHCKKPHLKRFAEFKYRGSFPYCGRECAGLARRVKRTADEKKEIKRLYDIEYRKKNRAHIKARKAAFFQKDYGANPEKYRAIRQARMKSHVEYCRRPEYKAKKHEYDRERYAKETYGPLWEIHVLNMKIAEESAVRMPRYERDLSRGLINKAQKRRRDANAKRSST